MNINSAYTIERVGDQWLVLADRDGVVHNLTGQAATVIDCVTTGQPIPPECDDAVATLVDSGILTPDTGWSRRKVLAAGGAAAAIGMVTLTLPTAAMASSNPGPAGINATAGSGQVSLTWTAVGGTTYQVFYKLSTTDDTNYITFGGPVAAGPVIVTGLTPASSYDFYVVSIVGGVQSAPSGVATAVPTASGGQTWTVVSNANAVQGEWNSVAYGNGVWVAVALANRTSAPVGQRVMRSTTNGATWTGVAAAEANTWMSVAYGNGVWVGVSMNGTNRVMRSTDEGLTWTAVAAPSAQEWVSVAHGSPDVALYPQGVWVAVASTGTSLTTGANRVMRSIDNGATWTSATATAPRNWWSVAYGNGRWVAVARDQSSVDTVMHSTDGETWTSANASFGADWLSVAYGNEVWVAVAEQAAGINFNRRVMRSVNNGTTWTSSDTEIDPALYSVAYGNGEWVAVAPFDTPQVIRSSDNGVSWNSTGITGVTDGFWGSVAYGNGRWVAVAGGNANSVLSRVMFS